MYNIDKIFYFRLNSKNVYRFLIVTKTETNYIAYVIYVYLHIVGNVIRNSNDNVYNIRDKINFQITQIKMFLTFL